MRRLVVIKFESEIAEASCVFDGRALRVVGGYIRTQLDQSPHFFNVGQLVLSAATHHLFVAFIFLAQTNKAMVRAQVGDEEPLVNDQCDQCEHTAFELTVYSLYIFFVLKVFHAASSQLNKTQV